MSYPPEASLLQIQGAVQENWCAMADMPASEAAVRARIEVSITNADPPDTPETGMNFRPPKPPLVAAGGRSGQLLLATVRVGALPAQPATTLQPQPQQKASTK